MEAKPYYRRRGMRDAVVIGMKRYQVFRKKTHKVVFSSDSLKSVLFYVDELPRDGYYVRDTLAHETIWGWVD